MFRSVLFFIVVISLFGCSGGQESGGNKQEDLQIASPEPTLNSVLHNTLANQDVTFAAESDCSVTEPLYFSDRVTDLNGISQQMFAIEGVEGVNGYANFLTVAQLATLTKAGTSDLIEQLGLVGITENEEWLDVFCYLEALTPTHELEIQLAESLLIRGDFYTTSTQKLSANFTSRDIDPEQDLWRASITNNWQIDLQLGINDEFPRFVSYQHSPDVEASIARAITVTDSINTVSNEFGDYYAVDNNSDFIVHIIMPTFEQYSHVKNNIVDVLDGFTALETTQLDELSLPYFSENSRSDSFIDFASWLEANWVGELFEDVNQDFSGINQFETFKLINNFNSNRFELNATGGIQSAYSNHNTLEALFFVEESHLDFASVSLQQVCSRSSNCSEVEVDSVWRPYFIIIENTDSQLIYSIVANGRPEFYALYSTCSTFVVESFIHIDIPSPLP